MILLSLLFFASNSLFAKNPIITCLVVKPSDNQLTAPSQLPLNQVFSKTDTAYCLPFVKEDDASLTPLTTENGTIPLIPLRNALPSNSKKIFVLTSSFFSNALLSYFLSDYVLSNRLPILMVPTFFRFYGFTSSLTIPKLLLQNTFAAPFTATSYFLQILSTPLGLNTIKTDEQGKLILTGSQNKNLMGIFIVARAAFLSLGFLDFTPLSNQFYLGSQTFGKKVTEEKQQDFLSDHELSIPLSELEILADQFPQLTFNLSPVAN